MPSSSRDPSSSAGSAEIPARIPTSFPLAAGWPRGTDEAGSKGLTGPNRTLPAVELTPCDLPADDPEYVDRLRADWSDVEDHRSRQLTLYRTDAEASEALLGIVDTYRSCPEQRHDGGFTTHFALAETAYGEESWSVAATETQQRGYATTYLNVVHIIRVGRALLVDTDSGEGGGGPPGTIERHMRSSASEAEAVIAAMCVFTTAGC